MLERDLILLIPPPKDPAAMAVTVEMSMSLEQIT
jgi:hypothetical protein